MTFIQVWDVRRLERDVTFASRLTYAGQSGRITGLCPVLDGSSVASGSSSGSLHVWRVEYTSKPGGWAPDKYRGKGVTEAGYTAQQTPMSRTFSMCIVFNSVSGWASLMN